MEGIRIDRRGSTLELTIDRPKANAIDSATSQAMGEAFVAFRDDPELRVAIVTGAGDRFFSAGWDLKAYAAGDPGDPDAFGAGGLAGLTELFDLDKPVIAAVNGYAAGGGFELALACDLIVATPDARFSLPEVKLGLVADSGGIFRLLRRHAPRSRDGAPADRRGDLGHRRRALGHRQPGGRARGADGRGARRWQRRSSPPPPSRRAR